MDIICAPNVVDSDFRGKWFFSCWQVSISEAWSSTLGQRIRRTKSFFGVNGEVRSEKI